MRAAFVVIIRATKSLKWMTMNYFFLFIIIVDTIESGLNVQLRWNNFYSDQIFSLFKLLFLSPFSLFFFFSFHIFIHNLYSLKKLSPATRECLSNVSGWASDIKNVELFRTLWKYLNGNNKDSMRKIWYKRNWFTIEKKLKIYLALP